MWDMQTPEANHPWPSRNMRVPLTHTVRTGWDQLLGMNARLHTSFQFRTTWGKCLTMTGRTNIKKDALLVGRQEMMLYSLRSEWLLLVTQLLLQQTEGGWMRTEVTHKSVRVQSRQFLKSPVFQIRALSHLDPHPHEHLLFSLSHQPFPEMTEPSGYKKSWSSPFWHVSHGLTERLIQRTTNSPPQGDKT